VSRGEIVTVAAGGGFGGKPRPAVIIQSNQFETSFSATVCLFTSDPLDAPLIRLSVEPSAENGLLGRSRLMVDKITTVPASKIGKRIGHLAPDDLLRLNRALTVFFGLAS
jgi:mRNA interferase MazF